VNDIEFIVTEIDKIMKEAYKYADKDNTTKKEFVIRLKEKTITYFELIHTPIAHLASYMRGGLDKIGFSISNSHFYDCFTDEEKGNYSGKFGSEQFIESNTPGVLKSVDSPRIKIDDVTYVPEIKEEGRSKTAQTDDDEPVVYKIDDYTDCLNRIAKSCSELYSSCQSILKKYTIGIWDKNKEIVIVTPEQIQKIVQDTFHPIEEIQQKYAKYYAKISNSKDVLDDRNKWGDYEKIMAKFLMDGGETIAHISKLMDYSSKFGSIGIVNNPRIIELMKQLGACPSCHKNIYFEINESLKEQEKILKFEI